MRLPAQLRQTQSRVALLIGRASDLDPVLFILFYYGNEGQIKTFYCERPPKMNIKRITMKIKYNFQDRDREHKPGSMKPYSNSGCNKINSMNLEHLSQPSC